ncbi:ankyrin repeat and KH domain-containing protein mask-like isoform X2 [Haliotis rufescens]|uniref:ankyrin repeat and KH domain-containing protein mask-like isoform X2 n=1 Tax=Haliotis rufescens TaxID=6454 RepID=UPI00201E97CA|nr:ankyrin repeat and KH domain-containing protein mask-like isoform X2 [Haliotis rufescens]
MMEITRVVFISLVLLCGVRDAHADTNLTALTGQVRVLTATIQAWKGRVVNIKTDMKQHFKRWESSLKNQLTDTFLPALIKPLVKQAITGILKEYNIRNIISGHVLDVVNNMKVSVQYTKTQLQAVKQQLRRVERERDNYKESLGKLRSELNQDIHSLQLQLNETVAGLLDAKMVNTVLRNDLITLNTSCVKIEEVEERTNDEQSYREGLKEMQQKLKTDIQRLNIQLNQTIDDLHDSKQVITGLTEDMVTLNASCVKREEVEERTSVEQSYREGLQEMQQKLKTDIQRLNIQLNQTIDDLHDSKQVITGLTEDMVTLNASWVMREDIKEVDVTDRSLTTSSLSQVSFTTSPPSFPGAAGASSDPSRTAWTPVTTTKKPATQATPSLADCYRLGVASRTGNVEEVKRLLSRGVDINCRGMGSTTPVMVAAYSGHRDVVELLVSKGADVSLVDKDGDSILHLACLRGHLGTVEFVLSLNVVDINSRGQGSMTPVMRAAMGGHRDVVELLVSKGADVSLMDKDGDSILHLACGGGHMETVRFVLSLNVVDINSRGLKSTTPMMRAAVGGHRDVVELLVSKGADVLLVDGVGNNVLHLACMIGDMETVEFVLSLNVVDIDARNYLGMTAADAARLMGRQPVVDLLVSRGAQ